MPGRVSYCCRFSENFHCWDRAGPHTSTLRPPVLAVRLSRHRLLPTCRSLELPSICSHFCKRQEDTHSERGAEDRWTRLLGWGGSRDVPFGLWASRMGVATGLLKAQERNLGLPCLATQNLPSGS